VIVVVNQRLDERYSNFLSVAIPYECEELLAFLNAGEWGIMDKVENKLKLLQDLQLLKFYLLMQEWKVYEQNTFFLTADATGCTLPKWISTVLEEENVKCICEYFECKYKINIEPYLSSIGALPLGVVPSGLSEMIVKEGSNACETNILEVNKK